MAIHDGDNVICYEEKVEGGMNPIIINLENEDNKGDKMENGKVIEQEVQPETVEQVEVVTSKVEQEELIDNKTTEKLKESFNDVKEAINNVEQSVKDDKKVVEVSLTKTAMVLGVIGAIGYGAYLYFSSKE